MKTILTILLIIFFNILNAQTIQFISKTTNQPLPKVSVFGKDGSILAYSDIEGKIDKNLITKDQAEYQLIYENESIAKLPYSAFENSIIKLNDRIREIETVVIKKGDQAKYIIVTGNFTSYVTLNNRLNCYADGIVSYVFERENGKLKSTNVLQYRIYTLDIAENIHKKTSLWDYKNFMETPDLKKITNLDDYKNNKAQIAELKLGEKDVMQVSGSSLKEKELSFLGYRLYDFNTVLNLSFEKNSKKQLRDIIDFSSITDLKLKHKTEDDYNQIIIYNNFHATEIDFGNNKKIEDVKFSKSKSNYKEKYWEKIDFPNLQIIFSQYFKEDLKEKAN
ncbi:hypothetical protein [Frigoriflavimonas asaccharolytica]|uniref:Uncharacterized protein n=1 Tax=Frigoriflavimonas asaccharolytica TaxID=2735899 RepID=A0A8J8G6S8_9FLAO|nr:hypothetical protein [Frigoriflavimonas asaccharolytica]NRS91032.1 hypothetical protein [Frigoriflavimonas asaccharolytica]